MAERYLCSSCGVTFGTEDSFECHPCEPKGPLGRRPDEQSIPSVRQERPRKNASKYVGYLKKTFYIRPDVEERLKDVSFRSRLDMSEILNQALDRHLDLMSEQLEEKEKA